MSLLQRLKVQLQAHQSYKSQRRVRKSSGQASGCWLSSACLWPLEFLHLPEKDAIGKVYGRYRSQFPNIALLFYPRLMPRSNAWD
ncbi:hypothetical protein CLIM01_13825 [Colletotrichum limetticola]|uniref:Uncharacterized protein n=1 Tax=Colletotrichum limetticola TaxID=1209924 RepID=A0ABQ9P9W7_9PEZI|nr:hypothetical protein CLIM01_13825 [Colletotrichum limetticola]